MPHNTLPLINEAPIIIGKVGLQQALQAIVIPPIANPKNKEDQNPPFEFLEILIEGILKGKKFKVINPKNMESIPAATFHHTPIVKDIILLKYPINAPINEREIIIPNKKAIPLIQTDLTLLVTPMEPE